MEANKKLNAALDAVFNSAEYGELHRVVMELRDNGGVKLHPDTARNIDVLAHVTGQGVGLFNTLICCVMEKKKYFVNIPFSGSLSVAVVAENEQAIEIGRKRLDAEIGQEAQFGHLEIYTL